MTTKKCKLCKSDKTLWEMIPELNGHICVECSYNLCSVGNEFDNFTVKALRINKNLDYLKRITRLLVTRWDTKQHSGLL